MNVCLRFLLPIRLILLIIILDLVLLLCLWRIPVEETNTTHPITIANAGRNVRRVKRLGIAMCQDCEKS